jgi:hypothetical protein
MDIMNELYDICDSLSQGIMEINDKIRKNQGKMSSQDLEYIDKLTHSMKSVKAVIAMMEEEDGGYSGRSMRGRSYRSMRGGYSGRRDAMGRYSREGDFATKLEELMEDAPPQMRSSIRDLQRQVEEGR